MEGGQEAVFGQLAFLARGAAGKVGADDRQLARRGVEAQFDIAAFGIELAAIKSDNHLTGLVPGINPDTGVTFFLGKMEMAL